MLWMARLTVICACAVMFGTAVVGCATVETGRDFDTAKAQSFQKGKATRKDIIGAMGAPSSTGSNSEGSFIEYQYTIIKQNGINDLLGTYGIGTIKTNPKSKLCRFIFESNDKLKNYSCSEGASS